MRTGGHRLCGVPVRRGRGSHLQRPALVAQGSGAAAKPELHAGAHGRVRGAGQLGPGVHRPHLRARGRAQPDVFPVRQPRTVGHHFSGPRVAGQHRGLVLGRACLGIGHSGRGKNGDPQRAGRHGSRLALEDGRRRGSCAGTRPLRPALGRGGGLEGVLASLGARVRPFVPLGGVARVFPVQFDCGPSEAPELGHAIQSFATGPRQNAHVPLEGRDWEFGDVVQRLVGSVGREHECARVVGAGRGVARDGPAGGP